MKERILNAYLSKVSLIKELLIILAGSCFLTLASKITLFLPFDPIPITMQTFAVFMLGFVLGPKRGAFAVIAFLGQATLGLPVLSTGYSPLWFLMPRAGYLIGFIFAAYAIGVLTRTKRSSLSLFLIFLLGDCILFSLGILVLSFFVGIDQAFTLGLMPLLIGEAYKLTAATLIAKGYQSYPRGFCKTRFR